MSGLEKMLKLGCISNKADLFGTSFLRKVDQVVRGHDGEVGKRQQLVLSGRVAVARVAKAGVKIHAVVDQLGLGNKTG